MPIFNTSEPLKTEFLGLGFDVLTLRQSVSRILAGARSPFRYVVTPNVDHMVRLEQDRLSSSSELKRLYLQADYCLCDSRILARLARFYRRRLTVVPGSDLTAAVLEMLNIRSGSVAIVGGWPDTVSSLQMRYANIHFQQHVPPRGLRSNNQALAEAADFVAEALADCTLLAVGSPQQEMIAAKVKHGGKASGIGLCIGASVDFLTGREHRAPVAFQRAGLEWLYRLCGNPRRLWKRYLVDGPRIFSITRRWRRSQRSNSQPASQL